MANSATNALSIFYGNGDGTFQQPPVSYAVGLNPQYTHSGNFSGGGVFDLSAANNLSNTISVLLNAGVAVTQLKSSNGSSTYGQSVTFTANVTPSNKGSAAPTGNVTFSDNGAALATITLNASGVASYSTAPLALNAGSHVITAAYSGDKNYYKNTTAFVQTVAKAAATAGLNSNLNPSTYGQNVTFNVSVTSAAGTPDGTVTLTDGTTQLATITLSSGAGSFSIATLAAGSHNLQASYPGDLNHLAATAPLSQAVNQAATSTSVTSSKNPSAVGDNVTFTATVTAPAGTSATALLPSGTVTFFDGATSLGTGMLNASGQATFPTTALAFGSHSITSTYAGDTNYLTSTSPAITQNVLHHSASAVTSPGAITFGQQVTFTATVTSPDPGTPTGLVTFFDGSAMLGTGTLNGASPDTATFTTTANQPLAAGTHSITAVYAGDSNFAPSTSATFNQTVNSVAGFSITSLTHVPLPVVHIGQLGTFTATLKNQSGSPVDDIVFSFSITGGRGYFVSGSFTISSGGAGTCDISSQPVTCDIGTMNPGDTATVIISGVPTLAHTLTATASANATTQTPQPDTVQVRFRPFKN